MYRRRNSDMIELWHLACNLEEWCKGRKEGGQVQNLVGRQYALLKELLSGSRWGQTGNSKIRSEYAQGETLYTKSRREPGEKKLMINGVRLQRGPEIQGRIIYVGQLQEEGRLNPKKDSFCGMEFSVGGF